MNFKAAATKFDLKKTMPKMPDELLTELVEEGVTMDDGRRRYESWQAEEKERLLAEQKRLREQIAELTRKKAEREERQAAKARRGSGRKPIKAVRNVSVSGPSSGNSGSGGSYRSQYRAKIDEVEATGVARFKAAKQVNARYPWLQKRMIDEAN